MKSNEWFQDSMRNTDEEYAFLEAESKIESTIHKYFDDGCSECKGAKKKAWVTDSQDASRMQEASSVYEDNFYAVEAEENRYLNDNY